MIEKLRKNYNLSNWISYLSCALFFCLSEWHYLSGQINILATMLGFVCTTWMAILIIVLEAALVTALVSPIAKLLLNFARIYFIPRNEYGVIVRLTVACYFALLSILTLTFLISPVVMVWGVLLYKVLVGFAVAFVFYRLTASFYCNNATKHYYFKVVAIVTIVYFVLLLLSFVSVV